jgi:cell fate (sporulation/competence/biofilm development) regulator YlbF (YheA/YmcA/DUF963 family)
MKENKGIILIWGDVMVFKTESLSFTDILYEVYELADLVGSSQELKDYVAAKSALANDLETQQQIADFNRMKELHEEVQRFGKYHPDYHRISKEVRVKKRELDMLPAVHRFKLAEKVLENMLFDISEIFAKAVSDTIKVPGNNPFAGVGGCGTGGCGSGGSCGCR